MTKPKPPGERRDKGFPPRLFVEVGQRLGRSIVIEADIRRPYPGRDHSQRKTERAVRLLCDCGKEYVTSIYSVIDGHNKGCGCWIRKPRRGDTPNEAARNGALGSYQFGARKRGLTWELTEEDFGRLTSQECYYCGAPPGNVRKSEGTYENGDFIYTGLDRKDNTLGYTPENVLPCCRICNRAKSTMSYGDFMAWIARLTAHHWFSPELTPSRRLKAVM